MCGQRWQPSSHWRLTFACTRDAVCAGALPQVWEDKDTFTAWRTGEAFKEAHGGGSLWGFVMMLVSSTQTLEGGPKPAFYDGLLPLSAPVPADIPLAVVDGWRKVRVRHESRHKDRFWTGGGWDQGGKLQAARAEYVCFCMSHALGVDWHACPKVAFFVAWNSDIPKRRSLGCSVVFTPGVGAHHATLTAARPLVGDQCTNAGITLCEHT